MAIVWSLDGGGEELNRRLQGVGDTIGVPIVGLELALCSFGLGDVGLHGSGFEGVAGREDTTGGGCPCEPGLGLWVSGEAESSWPSDWIIDRRDLAGEGQMAVVRVSMGLMWVFRWIVLSRRGDGERPVGERMMVSIESLDVTGVNILGELVEEFVLMVLHGKGVL
jgi:hypothetical protein